MRCLLMSFTVLLLIVAPTFVAAEVTPIAGCYEIFFDTKYLGAHKGQIVTRALALIKATDMPKSPEYRQITFDADIELSVKDTKDYFISHGSCWAIKGGISCNGSLSAADADTCKIKTTGLRDCRVSMADAGGFKVASRPKGVIVTISDRLELVQRPYNGGPFLV
jgi:hypothetical protein